MSHTYHGLMEHMFKVYPKPVSDAALTSFVWATSDVALYLDEEFESEEDHRMSRYRAMFGICMYLATEHKERVMATAEAIDASTSVAFGKDAYLDLVMMLATLYVYIQEPDVMDELKDELVRRLDVGVQTVARAVLAILFRFTKGELPRE